MDESVIRVAKMPRTMPQMFCPTMAKEHGLAVAAVEYAARELSRGQDKETYEEIKVSFELKALAEECWYLTEKEFKEACDCLFELGDFKEDGK